MLMDGQGTPDQVLLDGETPVQSQLQSSHGSSLTAAFADPWLWQHLSEIAYALVGAALQEGQGWAGCCSLRLSRIF